MNIKFGTDGIRGKAFTELSQDIVQTLGNALNGLIVIGQDTRFSSPQLTQCFINGSLDAGCTVLNLGVCPTSCVAYISHLLNANFGVMITASHNPCEYNGIKIFGKKGHKISTSQEKRFESYINQNKYKKNTKTGLFAQAENLVCLYKDYILHNFEPQALKNMRIVLDCANGVASTIAPELFSLLDADVIAINNHPNGKNINANCGPLYTESIKSAMIQYKADIGFAFDGDGDRVIAFDCAGNTYDGDMLLYIFATHVYKSKTVVGTVMTNFNVEKALNACGIKLLRTAVGDKHVSEALVKHNLTLGGEQSGHIILRDILNSGDGILNALKIASLCKKENKSLCEFFNFSPYPQSNTNVEVKDKNAILNNPKLKKLVEQENNTLYSCGRLLVRASGTEPCIRIMAECENKTLADLICAKIAQFVFELDNY